MKMKFVFNKKDDDITLTRFASRGVRVKLAFTGLTVYSS